MREWLAAGEGYAAAGIVVEDFVLEDFGEDFVRGHIFADEFEGAGIAALGAGAATGAVCAVEDVFAIAHAVALPGAVLEAPATADAFVRREEEFLLVAMGLGVVAPEATQGAAFEEDGGADAGAVVDREFFDIEDSADASHDGVGFLFYPQIMQIRGGVFFIRRLRRLRRLGVVFFYPQIKQIDAD